MYKHQRLFPDGTESAIVHNCLLVALRVASSLEADFRRLPWRSVSFGGTFSLSLKLATGQILSDVLGE